MARIVNSEDKNINNFITKNIKFSRDKTNNLGFDFGVTNTEC